MTDYKKYINALRKCAKEHENDKTSFGHIIVSDLCEDTANLLESLDQEPCDCISRQAAQSKIKNICNEYRLSYEDGERKAATGGSAYALGHAFDDLPPVTPKIEWIPVSERLPEDLEPVNITWVNHNPESYYKDIKDKPFTATGHYCNGRWWWYSVTCQDYLNEYGRCDVDAMDNDIEVIAWMPLPEPYTVKKE